jgi:hypothetical protein
MRNRSEALTNLKDLFEVQLAKVGVTVKLYQSDGAPELMGKAVINYLSTKGCSVTYSPAYTPELNSLVERNHRTIFEMSYAMILGCNLPIQFWDHAVRYATMIYNRLPTNTLYGYMSPYEARHKTTPDVSRFKIFGCLAFVHIPKEKREKGFNDRAHKGHFIGFCPITNWYQVYTELGKIESSAHVLFDEVTLVPRVHGSSMLQVAPETRVVADFTYLEGMVYEDDHIRYVTTRVVQQRGYIVAYRGMYYVREDDRGNTRYITGPEEPHPIHVADVVILVRKYQQDNIAVVLDGQRSLHLTKVDERTGQLSQISADNNAQSTEIENSGVQSVVEEVPQGVTVAPRNRPPVAVNTSAPHPEVHNLTSNGMHKDMHQEEHDGPDQPMSARPSRNKPRTIINVGTLGDTSPVANLSFKSYEYVLFTPDSHSTSGTQEE